MTVWAEGDALSPSNLNNNSASATSVTGFSTNTLTAETGSAISALGQTLTVSALSSVGTAIADAVWTSNISVGSTLTATAVVLSGSTILVTETGTGGGLAGDAAGAAGEIAWGSSSNASFIYVCVSANSWMRATLNPF